ncbi:recombinase family protein [Candidatus Albibeggiatoa sp. nov. BB20]|uniref:recombinase family protein n=1 Tax=Candidatus Albibeggiatoa sp. nov. BB20 TaxID=3162723 RepID=UPI0033657CD9
MTIYAYLRVSTGVQDVNAQKTAVMEWAVKHGHKLDFIEDSVTSRKDWTLRKIGSIVESVQAGDIVVASDVTRLARSAMECLQIQEEILKKGGELHTVNENLVFKPPHTGQSEIDNVMKEMMLLMLGQMGKLQRAFISKKTKEGIQHARDSGKQIGRQKGQQVVRKLDYHYDAILQLLKRGHSQISVIRILNEKPDIDIHRNTFTKWMKHWKLRTLTSTANVNDKIEYNKKLDQTRIKIKQFLIEHNKTEIELN